MTDSSGRFTPTLAEVIRLGAESVLGEANFALPARVVEYFPELQRADLEIPIQERRRPLEEWGDDRFFPFPMLIEVPVCFPCGGDFAIHFDLRPGDAVFVVFADRSIEEWIEIAEVGIEQEDPRRFDVSDGYCFPVAATVKPGALPEPARVPGALTIGKRDGSAQLRIEADGTLVYDGPGVKLGANAADAVALASKVESEIAALWDALKTHTHTSSPPSVATGPAITPPPGVEPPEPPVDSGTLTASTNSVGSTKTLSE